MVSCVTGRSVESILKTTAYVGIDLKAGGVFRVGLCESREQTSLMGDGYIYAGGMEETNLRSATRASFVVSPHRAESFVTWREFSLSLFLTVPVTAV